MRLGHGHRQAVVLLWAWTALLSGLVLWPGVTDSHNEIPPIAAGALAIGLYTVFAPKGRASLASDASNGNGDGANAKGQPPNRRPRKALPAPQLKAVTEVPPYPLVDGQRRVSERPGVTSRLSQVGTQRLGGHEQPRRATSPEGRQGAAARAAAERGRPGS
jgi:hypothetical protein